MRGMKRLKVKECVDENGNVIRYVDIEDLRDWFLLSLYEQITIALNQEKKIIGEE